MKGYSTCSDAQLADNWCLSKENRRIEKEMHHKKKKKKILRVAKIAE